VNTAPCPRCGRQPRLIEGFKYAHDEPRTDQSIILLKYECRRWFGLLRCFTPCDWHWIEKGWFDVGHSEAVRKWNEAVDESKGASL
jgi:hypothetical protein